MAEVRPVFVNVLDENQLNRKPPVLKKLLRSASRGFRKQKPLTKKEQEILNKPLDLPEDGSIPVMLFAQDIIASKFIASKSNRKDIKRETLSKEEIDLTLNIINEVCKTDIGKSVMKKAYQNGFSFGCSKAIAPNNIGLCQKEPKTILLNARNFSHETLFSTIVHEARHSSQANDIKQKKNPRKLDALSGLAWTCAEEADAVAISVAFAYEYKQKTGNDKPWKEVCFNHKKSAQNYEKAKTENKSENACLFEAFKGWCDSLDYVNNGYYGEYEKAIRGAYVQSTSHMYELNNTVPAKDIINSMCKSLDEKTCYFADNPKTLKSSKYIKLNNKNLEMFKFTTKTWKNKNKKEIPEETKDFLENYGNDKNSKLIDENSLSKLSVNKNQSLR